MSEPSLNSAIRALLDAGNIEAVISLAESLRDQRDRAEMKVTAYLHEIKELATRFANITEPKTGRKLSDPKENPSPVHKSESVSVSVSESGSGSKPRKEKQKEKHSSAIDIDLDL
jgi:hypothetical protein